MYEMEYGASQRITDFMVAVYGWMAAALIMSAVTAWYVAQTPAIFITLYTNSFMLFSLIAFQFAMVVVLSFFLSRMNFVVAALCFILYALSLGVTLSSILHIYTPASVYTTFLVTAGTFGVMSLYGLVTRRDLTGIGSIAMMALLGLIIALVVNIFLKSQTFDYVISGLGVLIFTLLIAYDTQKLKKLSHQMVIGQDSRAKIALLGALMLYLDFINLFLFLLRFTGQQREA